MANNNEIQFENITYLGNEFVSQGTTKAGKPWTKYKAKVTMANGANSSAGVFVPLTGKSLDFMQLQGGQQYSIGYKEEPYTLPDGKIIQLKTVIGFYPARADYVPQQQQQQPVTPNGYDTPAPQQQKTSQQGTITANMPPVPAQATLDVMSGRQQELETFANAYRQENEPTTWNVFHFMLVYMMMKNKNLAPLIEELKVAYKSKVMGQ